MSFCHLFAVNSWEFRVVVNWGLLEGNDHSERDHKHHKGDQWCCKHSRPFIEALDVSMLPDDVGRLCCCNELRISTKKLFSIKAILHLVSIGLVAKSLCVVDCFCLSIIRLKCHKSAHRSCEPLIVIWILNNLGKLFIKVLDLLPLAACNSTSSLLQYVDHLIIVIGKLNVLHLDRLYSW